LSGKFSRTGAMAGSRWSLSLTTKQLASYREPCTVMMKTFFSTHPTTQGKESSHPKSKWLEFPMTKIVCTIGPATDQEDTMQALVDGGMSVARLNFSHAGDDYSYPEENTALIRNARGIHAELLESSRVVVDPDDENSQRINNVRGLLVDTKGPEIRTGPLQGNAPETEIAAGAQVVLTTQNVSEEDAPGTPEGPHRIQVDYQSIASTLSVGGQALLDDGLLALEVVNIDLASGCVHTVALNGGPIKKNKGVNLPNCTLDLPALTEKDKRDLQWAVDVGADYVAASFVRTASNVRSVIAFLDGCVADADPSAGQSKNKLRPLVISKIESAEGVENFGEILDESDGIMVARGDLGVEIPYSQVFAVQKEMVAACNAVGKPVIVATQMLDSMQRNPRPTRAEVTDVGTAVLDGADAVMLSGETAAGKYPIESIRAMSSVLKEADRIVISKGPPKKNNFIETLKSTNNELDAELDAVAFAAVGGAADLPAKLIVVITVTGKSARYIARHRPTVPVLAFCTDAQVARRLQLHRGITPIMLQSTLDPDDPSTSMSKLRAEALRTAKQLGFVRAGERVVTVDRTRGRPHDLHHYSHNMKVATLRD